ncbi:hypothetical protein ABTY20_13875 [Streptomyces sp. NPDC126497]|uniref:hypothetical protein n=1 Tax=Streptomyces sp. NPDC126497 TaxID=3155313 RepID=UPI003319B1B8
MNQDAAYTLDELRKLDPAVRADVLCVLDRVVRDLPAHWRRRTGVPQLMVFLDGHGDARTERTGLRELARHGFLDEFHRWVRGVPAERAQEHGCAALVYGDRIHARINRIGPFGSPRFAPDTRVHVQVAHRDLRMAPGFSFPFGTGGRLFPRLVFHDWVPEILDRARLR